MPQVFCVNNCCSYACFRKKNCKIQTKIVAFLHLVWGLHVRDILRSLYNFYFLSLLRWPRFYKCNAWAWRTGFDISAHLHHDDHQTFKRRTSGWKSTQYEVSECFFDVQIWGGGIFDIKKTSKPWITSKLFAGHDMLTSLYLLTQTS